MALTGIYPLWLSYRETSAVEKSKWYTLKLPSKETGNVNSGLGAGRSLVLPLKAGISERESNLPRVTQQILGSQNPDLLPQAVVELSY